MAAFVTQRQIEEELGVLGIADGDVVLLHSSLSSFGVVEGGARAVVDAFLSVLGADGTLAVPAFKGAGAIAEYVAGHPLSVTSEHPLAAVAAIGQHAEDICRDHWKAESPHGLNTPYTRIAGLGGLVCLAGVDFNSNTTLHTVEALLELPYLEEYQLSFETRDGPMTRHWKYVPGAHRDFLKAEAALRERELVRMGGVGECVVRVIPGQPMINTLIEIVRGDPAFFLCGNPNCRDCVRQRALIRRARLGKERFTLAASSALAGRYASEIAEQLGGCGLTAVELDVLEGVPVHRLPAPVLRAAVATLRQEGFRITALRATTLPESVAAFMDLAVENKIDRIVIPLVPAAEAYVRAAAERGLCLSFSNSIQSTAMTSRILLSLDEAGLETGFTCNPAAFAATGEHLNQFVLHSKIAHFLDQVDLADGCFDGTPQPLGEGHGDIKGIVSKLRCASFKGVLTLGAGNRAFGGLMDAVKRFEAMLAAM